MSLEADCAPSVLEVRTQPLENPYRGRGTSCSAVHGGCGKMGVNRLKALTLRWFYSHSKRALSPRPWGRAPAGVQLVFVARPHSAHLFSASSGSAAPGPPSLEPVVWGICREAQEACCDLWGPVLPPTCPKPRGFRGSRPVLSVTEVTVACVSHS